MSKKRPKTGPAPPSPAPALRRHPDWWIAILLLATTLAVYSQVRHFDFVNYDDPEYVLQNPQVRAGLTSAGLVWAITSFAGANWFPLTWISHMADCQFFGLDGGWHHLTSVGLHALNVLLLFAVLRRITGARWRSALVAFLFALHPLHVESVAWVAERKDVLCAFFWFSTIWLYARYVERPGLGRYLPVVAAFCLGLMAKPMIVTLPFVLLLLDVWPLRRTLGKSTFLEKLPLLALSAAASWITFLAQKQAGAVAPLAQTTLSSRLETALAAYLAYIGDMFWPAGLAMLYPLRPSIPWHEVAAAAVVLAGISLLAVRQFRARPYLAVGWCWYLGTLVPVIGLVQVGSQSHADRYTYVPLIGLSIMLAWGAADLIAWRPAVRKAVIAAIAVAAAACLPITWLQIRHWESTETLNLHALRVTDGNFILRHNLAEYYLQRNRVEEARQLESEALSINPNYVEARLDLALALSMLGRHAEAEAEYRKGLDLKPEGRQLIVAHAGLGAALASQHRTAEALPELQLAVQLRPDSAEGRFNLANALAELRRYPEAASEFAAAVSLDPDDPESHRGLALAFTAIGKLDEAAGEFAAVAKLRPGDPVTQYNLAIALARVERLDDAIQHFSEALRLRPDFTAAREGLQIAQAQRDASKH